MGRPPIGDTIMSSTERSRRTRERAKAAKLAAKPDAAKLAAKPSTPADRDQIDALRRENDGLLEHVATLKRMIDERDSKIRTLDKATSGLVSRAEYDAIRKCLHTDTLEACFPAGATMPVELRKRYDEAFTLFQSFKLFSRSREQDARTARSAADYRDALARERARRETADVAARDKAEAKRAERRAAKVARDAAKATGPL